MAIELIAKVRRFIVGKAGLSPIIARATGMESLAVAQVESANKEMTQSGDRFQISFVNALPAVGTTVAAQATTIAQVTIWNNDYQKSYVFDTLGMVMTSGVLTTPFGFVIQCCLFQTPGTPGSQLGGIAVSSCSNGGPSSKALIKAGVTITTPAAPVWYTIAKSDVAAVGVTAQPQFAAVNRDLRGRIILPPQQGLGLNAYAITTGTPKFAPIASWTELELDLE